MWLASWRRGGQAGRLVRRARGSLFHWIPMNQDDYLFHAGEATVLAAEGQFTDAMPEVLIGRVDGPVGQAFANMMAQSKGHTAMFAIRACNQLVRPATMLVPKVTLKDSANIELFGGVVQSATADAIVDLLIEGVIPKDMANRLCIISLVWIDPRCAGAPDLDKKDMYRTNYEATKLALRRALANEPTVDELIANRHTIRHDMDDWS
jgi:formaldehyde-activating enzyme